MDDDDPMRDAEAWYGSLRQPTKAIPPILYHYCSIDSFVKIVTTNTLRLTNLFFLNDRDEHFLLRDKSMVYIAEQLVRTPDDQGYLYLQAILKNKWPQELYCTCFTEHSDNLGQWRGYGDDGKGVAIGFDSQHVSRVAKHLFGNIANVIYEDAEQMALIERAFDLPPNLSDAEIPTVDQGCLTILGRISEAASRCKSDSFAEEAEWRVVCSSRNSMLGPNDETIWTKSAVPRFMERRGVITPYMEIPLVGGGDHHVPFEEPIVEVIFGPKSPLVDQEDAANQMLRSAGIKRVRVKRSRLSYR